MGFYESDRIRIKNDRELSYRAVDVLSGMTGTVDEKLNKLKLIKEQAINSSEFNETDIATIDRAIELLELLVLP